LPEGVHQQVAEGFGIGGRDADEQVKFAVQGMDFGHIGVAGKGQVNRLLVAGLGFEQDEGVGHATQWASAYFDASAAVHETNTGPNP
jgi:hypothetical protein